VAPRGGRRHIRHRRASRAGAGRVHAARRPRWAYYSRTASAGRRLPRPDPHRRSHRRHPPAAAGLEAPVSVSPPCRRPVSLPWAMWWPPSFRRSRAVPCSWPRRRRSAPQQRGRRRYPFRPTPQVDLETLFWTIGFRGRPAVLLATVLEELIRRSSVGGACSTSARRRSASRDCSPPARRLRGHRPAIIAAHPDTEAEFRRVGAGRCSTTLPTTGGRVSDVRGGRLADHRRGGLSLAGKRVLGSGRDYQIDSIVAGNAELQRRLIEVCSEASYPTGRGRVLGRAAS